MKLERIIGVGVLLGGIGLVYFDKGLVGYPLIVGSALYLLAEPNDYLKLKHYKETHEENKKDKFIKNNSL